MPRSRLPAASASVVAAAAASAALLLALAAAAGDAAAQLAPPDGAPPGQCCAAGPAPGQFSSPEGIDMHRVGGGPIVVADTGNHRVQVFHRNGTFDFEFGTRGDGDGEFESPASISLGSRSSISDMIAVADTGNHRIQVFHPDGTFAFKFGTRGDGDGEFESPAGVAFDYDDIILVADTGNHRVQMFSIDGEFLYKFGSHGSGPLQFDGPRDVHGGSEADTGILVADTGNDRIQLISEPTHQREAMFDSAIGPNATDDEPVNRPRTGNLKLDGPSSIDVGRHGGFRLAVADTGNDRVQISWSLGKYPRNFGSAGTGVGEFWSPSDVAMNWWGAFAVADTGNHRVQVFGHNGALQFEIGAKAPPEPNGPLAAAEALMCSIGGGSGTSTGTGTGGSGAGGAPLQWGRLGSGGTAGP